MNLYLLTQTANSGYDTFDAIIVAAVDEQAAIDIVPISSDFVGRWDPDGEQILWDDGKPYRGDAWAPRRDLVTCRKIGVAEDDVGPGIVLASFRAG